jgi:3-methylcrotonyl-CoA carboxylase beta subunit
MIGKKYENEGIAKNGAKLVTAVASAKVCAFLFFTHSFG